MIKVLLLVAVALSPTTLAAQQKEAPKQCRAGWTITDDPNKRHGRNTGAAYVDFISKRYHSKVGVDAFSNPPQNTSQYPNSVPIEVTDLQNGARQFVYRRKSDNAFVVGVLSPVEGDKWQMSLSVQLPGYVTATGLCIE